MAPEPTAADGGGRTGDVTPLVVVVEDQAHLRRGHYPVLFAELADAFDGIGCPTVALTARGWSGGTATRNGVPIIRYGPSGRLLAAAGRMAARVAGRRPSWGPILDPVGRGLRELALVHEAVRLVHLVDPARPRLVVSLCHGLVPWLPAVVDGARPRRWRRGHRSAPVRWVLHAHYGAPAPPRPALRRLMAWAEHRRRAHGGRMVVGVQDPDWVPAWRQAAEPVEARHLPLTGLRPTAVVSRAEARRRLDLPPDRPLVLAIGAADPAKDLATVGAALARLHGSVPDDGRVPWLLLAGGVAEQFDVGSTIGAGREVGSRAREDPPWLLRRPGHYDATTRDLLPVAADAVVLSFVPGHRRASATLMDAVSAGTPVVASSDSQVAELVERHGLGAVFASGDPADLAAVLAAAVRQPLTVAPDDLSRARQAMSLATIARRHLEETDQGRPVEPRRG